MFSSARLKWVNTDKMWKTKVRMVKKTNKTNARNVAHIEHLVEHVTYNCINSWVELTTLRLCGFSCLNIMFFSKKLKQIFVFYPLKDKTHIIKRFKHWRQAQDQIPTVKSWNLKAALHKQTKQILCMCADERTTNNPPCIIFIQIIR